MTAKCSACKDGLTKPMAFSMAFQPIVDVEARRVYAYEALVRGPQGQPASTVLDQVTPENLYAFDQTCRVQAITLATELGLVETGACLSINFLPGAVYSPAACIQLTLKTAREMNFPSDRLIFEVVETEKVKDVNHLQAIAEEYKKHGFRIAIDDFGAGFANVGLFADLAADVVKLDMHLIRKLHQRPRTQVIVKAIADMCRTLRCEVIAEGVETLEEYAVLRSCGIRLMQGYLIARPQFEALPQFTLPALSEAGVAPLRTTPVVPPALFQILSPALGA